MSKNSMIVIAALTGVLLIGGVAFAQNSSQNNSRRSEQAAMMRKEAETLAMKKEKEVEAMKKDKQGDAMVKQADAASSNGAAVSKGSYTDYDQAKLANAESGKVVLFFHAPWCPTCKEANKNFEASATPDSLTLLKVDYDSSKDLKKKYGVTYQHTFVQVNKDGNLLKKWSGSTSYDAIKAEEI